MDQSGRLFRLGRDVTLALSKTLAGIGDDGSEQVDHLRRVPFGGPKGTPDFLTSTVDDECGRQAHGAQPTQGLPGRIGVDRKVANVDLGVELADGSDRRGQWRASRRRMLP